MIKSMDNIDVLIAACDYKKITKNCQKCYRKLERKAGFNLIKSPELHGELLELIGEKYAENIINKTKFSVRKIIKELSYFPEYAKNKLAQEKKDEAAFVTPNDNVKKIILPPKVENEDIFSVIISNVFRYFGVEEAVHSIFRLHV